MAMGLSRTIDALPGFESDGNGDETGFQSHSGRVTIVVAPKREYLRAIL